MTVARTSAFFFGTSETVGVTIANNATQTGSQVDVLGNNTSEGWLFLYLYYTSTVTAGSLDESLFTGQDTGQTAQDQAPLAASIVPINGTQKIQLTTFPAARFMIGQTKNNATGASATNVSLGYDLYQES
jgi:hypothetical protein